MRRRQRRQREPLWQHADDRHAARRQVEQHGQDDRDDHGDEDARGPWRDPFEAEDDGQAEHTDRERPRVRHIEALDECLGLGDQPIRVGAEAEQLGQLADEDHHRETGQVAGPDRVRQQVGDEPEPADPRTQAHQPDEEGEHPRERDGLLLVPRRERQDRRRDHRPER